MKLWGFEEDKVLSGGKISGSKFLLFWECWRKFFLYLPPSRLINISVVPMLFTCWCPTLFDWCRKKKGSQGGVWLFRQWSLVLGHNMLEWFSTDLILVYCMLIFDARIHRTRRKQGHFPVRVRVRTPLRCQTFAFKMQWWKGCSYLWHLYSSAASLTTRMSSSEQRHQCQSAVPTLWLYRKHLFHSL